MMNRFLRSRGLWRVICILFFVVFGIALIAGCVTVTYLVFPPPPMNILIVGMDDGEHARLPVQPNTMLLVTISPTFLRVRVLSIPGDVLMDVPEAGFMAVNQLGDDPHRWRLAFTQTFGVRVDRYIRLDFAAFAALVDAVGGIEVDVERVLEDERYPADESVDDVRRVRFESGIQRMDGDRALQYARIIGDYGTDDRVRRQGQLLLALSLPLRNPAAWPAVWQVLTNETETDLSLWDVATLTPALIFTAGRYETLTVDEDYAVSGVSGRHIDFDALLPWLQSYAH